MEVKDNVAHVTTQRILNKFIEVNSSVGYMYGLAVMLSISTQTTSKNIDEIRMRSIFIVLKMTFAQSSYL